MKNKLLLSKYKTAIGALAKMERLPVYFGKKQAGRLIGIELNNIYCDEIMIQVESVDYQEVNNYLLKDIKFKK